MIERLQLVLQSNCQHQSGSFDVLRWWSLDDSSLKIQQVLEEKISRDVIERCLIRDLHQLRSDDARDITRPVTSCVSVASPNFPLTT